MFSGVKHKRGCSAPQTAITESASSAAPSSAKENVAPAKVSADGPPAKKAAKGRAPKATKAAAAPRSRTVTPAPEPTPEPTPEPEADAMEVESVTVPEAADESDAMEVSVPEESRRSTLVAEVVVDVPSKAAEAEPQSWEHTTTVGQYMQQLCDAEVERVRVESEEAIQQFIQQVDSTRQQLLALLA